MKYIVTLRDKTYEVEVEHGEAMLLDEYEAKAPVPPAAAAPMPMAVAPAAAAAAPLRCPWPLLRLLLLPLRLPWPLAMAPRWSPRCPATC